jgi:Raf kinase inhibitor-like YbhB/YbcL family protein
MRIRFVLSFALFVALTSLAFRSAAGHSASPAQADPGVTASWQQAPEFRVTSSTFGNNQTLPFSMIYEFANPNGTNACSADGTTGGNQSPELSWTDAGHGTVTYAVIAFDATAAFTHWGIYDITPTTVRLPENAGVAGTSEGAQIVDDFGLVGYNGPCPPPGAVHQYVFTVYAVDTYLKLPGSTTFPANSETLFRALIGHVVDSASITGFFSSTPPQ